MMIRRTPTIPRRGVAMTVVLIFLILLCALWCMVFSTTSSVLQIESNRISQQVRDQGSMNALAQAIRLLEYSKPSGVNRTQFTYGVTIPNASGAGPSSYYSVVYQAAPTAQDPLRWQVQVSPAASSVSPQLPLPGANPQWP
jgi:hypothetical protein